MKEVTTVERRRFIVKAGGALAAAGAAAAVDAPNVIAQPKIQWRMSTAYTASTVDVAQHAAEQLGKIVEETSGGRFRIEVFPGGQIMGPFECFDATSKGTDIQAFMGSPQYWSAREPAIEWFATIPFGMNPAGMAAWLYQGDGLKLMEEAYGAFNIVPRPAMANSPQMAGWFRKKITTTSDFRGLKMRIVNLGGRVYAKAGATTVLTPGSEIYAALERGVIDTAEWIGPHYDMLINLHQTARYYYYPGWHEPGTTLDFGFNKKAYEGLPVDLRRILDHASAAVQVYGLAEHNAKNAIALHRLRTEFKDKVEVLPFPAPVLRDLRKLAGEVLREESERTPMTRKVHASFTKFQALIAPWDHVAEGAYHQFVAG
jgi:TRAP-type mannitol/chloroaromatic compound transport system substrate-binding protein